MPGVMTGWCSVRREIAVSFPFRRNDLAPLRVVDIEEEDVAVARRLRREELAPGQAREAGELNPLVGALDLLRCQVRAEGPVRVADDGRVVRRTPLDAP